MQLVKEGIATWDESVKGTEENTNPAFINGFINYGQLSYKLRTPSDVLYFNCIMAMFYIGAYNIYLNKYRYIIGIEIIKT